MNEVIEMMAKEIIAFDWSEKPMCAANAIRLSEALLDLRYPCEDCGGGSEVQEETYDSSGNVIVTGFAKCPTCKGTGHLGKVLAVLAESQNTGISEYIGVTYGFRGCMEILTTPKDGYVWRRVRE